MSAHQNVYFHHGGFHAMNQFIGSIQEIAANKDDFSDNPNFYGCSAGAGYALVCYLVFHGYIPIEKVERDTYAGFDKPRPISAILTPIYCDLIDTMVGYWPRNLYELVSGVLHIAVSTQTGFKWISQYKSNYDVYNAIMCAGTIVGFTSYASIYDGTVCLDGAYQFRYRYLPDKCFFIDIPLSPIALTIPPTIIRPYLVAQGRDKVRICRKPQAEHDELSVTFVTMMFVIHSQVIPDPQWEKHLRAKTQN
jgi:hypothetical protein